MNMYKYIRIYTHTHRRIYKYIYMYVYVYISGREIWGLEKSEQTQGGSLGLWGGWGGLCRVETRARSGREYHASGYLPGIGTIPEY